MNAAGWAAESKAGYTLAALFEKQLKHIKWIRKQGDMAVVSLLLHAHKAFLRALADCETAHLRMLSHPEPAAAKLDYLLEFNGPYDEALKEKTKGMAPMVLIRRALPELLPPSADRSLSGVGPAWEAACCPSCPATYPGKAAETSTHPKLGKARRTAHVSETRR